MLFAEGMLFDIMGLKCVSSEHYLMLNIALPTCYLLCTYMNLKSLITQKYSNLVTILTQIHAEVSVNPSILNRINSYWPCISFFPPRKVPYFHHTQFGHTRKSLFLFLSSTRCCWHGICLMVLSNFLVSSQL